MRALAATGNRIALDLFIIIGRETLRRHESLEIAEHSDQHLTEAVTCLCNAVDKAREAGVADDYPALRFLMLNITALVDEMEKRGMVKELQ
jgi:hypothetical protein